MLSLLAVRHCSARAKRRWAALNTSRSDSLLKGTKPCKSRPLRRNTTDTRYTRPFHTSNKIFQTHYEILGISKNATLPEIRKAYRQKAKQYHPDLNKASNAHSKFVAVKEAYECLKDPARKSHYDAGLGGARSNSYAGRASGGDPFEDFMNTARRQRAQQRSQQQYTNEFRAGGQYGTPRWDFSEAERQMWEDLKTRRDSDRDSWYRDNQAMDEEIRKSEEMERVRRRLMPYFNLFLVGSLLVMAGGSLYMQYSRRYNRDPDTSGQRNFRVAVGDDDHGYTPVLNSRKGVFYTPPPADFSDEHSTSTMYASNQKYQTRWDDIQDSVRRRDQFYRSLLRNPPSETD